MPERSSKSVRRWTSFTIPDIPIPRACYARCRAWVRVSRKAVIEDVYTRSMEWFRISCTCRRDVLLAPAATNARSNARSLRLGSKGEFAAFMPEAPQPLLSVQHLKKYFPIHGGIF